MCLRNTADAAIQSISFFGAANSSCLGARALRVRAGAAVVAAASLRAVRARLTAIFLAFAHRTRALRMCAAVLYCFGHESSPSGRSPDKASMREGEVWASARLQHPVVGALRAIMEIRTGS
jgi:hypothetical protein